ncbi:redox-regulated ATPase YchF [Patescibacteria group bacterium]|nr:redox-regulated ATPase YchF [Patescibacteria group bacterium]MBU2633480.1 redox-regulated ATPase YchF [Patescibacteria group bacterium]
MKIGIVGLPNVGKSTLFKALTRIPVDINNYPFCTIEPNIGIVEIPDKRVDRLAEIFSSRKKIYAVIEFVDIAGLIEGAAEGQGLGNKFLHHIREVDAIIQVVRMFENEKIIHVRGKIHPKEDIGIINTELILADIETVQKRISKLEKQSHSGDKDAIKQLRITKELEEVLNGNDVFEIKKFADSLGKNVDLIKDLHLLSLKPSLYVLNVDSYEKLEEQFSKFSIDIADPKNIAIDTKTEEEILELSEEEKKELKLKSQLEKLTKGSYDLLGLMTFLTSGEDETRAWTIPKNSTAPRAGRAIHSDFENKFIRADVIPYAKLIEARTMEESKKRNFVQTVGKNYIVQDGDIIEFRI